MPIAQSSDNVSVVRAAIAPGVPPRPADLVIPITLYKVGDTPETKQLQTARAQRSRSDTEVVKRANRVRYFT